ncbi:uncharacterized protein LOC141693293 [Apium graveolens]|uniref:uncharacterized protein LOC141693293 n=1 Tax=Apium graveolens TaxID=4045 RepID=UPI003D79A1AD
MTEESTRKVTLTKAIFGPKKIHKKPKCSHKGSSPHKRCSLPKGKIEVLEKKGSLLLLGKKGLEKKGSRYTHSTPGLCSGKTSLETFREGVIAFSQRQMHDIESIAVKLMTELNSMKDIMEQKKFDDADRCTSMKNDAVEVKLAIKNVERVEKKTKKWLSMMTRDCHRFCKIMSEPQRSMGVAATARENILHKKRKRISFADEAGGLLCHVKYFSS